jgi:hypothetical protein
VTASYTNCFRREIWLTIFALVLNCFFTGLVTNGVVPAKSLDSNLVGAKQPLRVLFIGNSFTYFNNLPRLLEQFSASAGRSLQTRMVVEGGATLKDQWDKGDALKAIREGGWDYVVLQDQSTLGVFLINGQSHIADPKYFYKYALLFQREIERAGSRTIFYLTWAREDAPARDQVALNYAYTSIARQLRSLLAPVGIVWQQVRYENPKLSLYIEDKSHPQGPGSYLAACVFYATIYNESPLGLPNQIAGNPTDDDGNVDTKKNVTLVNLSSGDAALIQRTAWQTYERMQRLGGYLPAPKPPQDPLPKLPRGRRPAVKDLEGSWAGPFRFYPVPWPATMELKLHAGELKAELKIKFDKHPESDKTPQITSVKIDEQGISFLDAKGVNGAPMRYTAAYNGNTLSGIVEAKAEDSPIHAIGTWELKRQD